MIKPTSYLHERNSDPQAYNQIFQNQCFDFHVFTKIARIENRLPEFLGELEPMSCDMFFFFCETRCALGDIGLEGGHALYTSREPTNNAGVAILAHNDRVVKVNEIPVCAQDFVCRNQLVLSPHTRSMLDTISAFWMSFMTIWIPLWKMVAAGVMN